MTETRQDTDEDAAVAANPAREKTEAGKTPGQIWREKDSVEALQAEADLSPDELLVLDRLMRNPEFAAILERERKKNQETQELDPRELARLHRERGRRRLMIRHAGVISRMTRVSINERTAASAFERLFCDMEDATFVIWRIAQKELDHRAHQHLLEKVENQIDNCQGYFENELARLRFFRDYHCKGVGELTYAHPALECEVQLRTRGAERVLDIFWAFDEMLMLLRRLEWSLMLSPTEATEAERKGKLVFFGLRRFLTSQAIHIRSSGSQGAQSETALPEPLYLPSMAFDVREAENEGGHDDSPTQ